MHMLTNTYAHSLPCKVLWKSDTTPKQELYECIWWLTCYVISQATVKYVVLLYDVLCKKQSNYNLALTKQLAMHNTCPSVQYQEYIQ
jgi:hypothetical protein